MAQDDPFAMLGLPRRFDLDRAALQRAYLKAAALLHPDRFSDGIEQAEAAAKAARLNTARDVLADDERRANALLALTGGPGRDDDDSLPDGVLMEIMEARQEMEHAMAGGDAAERKRVEEWAHEERAGFIERIGALFEEAQGQAEGSDGGSKGGPKGGPRGRDVLREIRVQLNAWRYIERMIEQLDPDHELNL